MEDYLGLEAQLTSYLATWLPEVPVLSLDHLAAIDRANFRGAAVIVMYAGEEVPKKAAGQGHDQWIEQRWLTVVAVQSAAPSGDGRAVRALAGPILDRLGRLLQGHKFTGYRPLRRLSPPQPRYTDGFAHFPLLWEIPLVVAGESLPPSHGAMPETPFLTWVGDQVAIFGTASGPHLTGPQGPPGDCATAVLDGGTFT
jgi:hypothetical protein